MTKVTITVTVDGNEVWRKYNLDMDNLTDETYGHEVVDMIETIMKSEEPI